MKSSTTEQTTAELKTVDAANARFFRILGDATRLAILNHLLRRPHSVLELATKLNAPQSRVSNHLACLRWCHFVTAERHGRQIIYTINNSRLTDLLELATDMAAESREHLASCRRMDRDWA